MFRQRLEATRRDLTRIATTGSMNEDVVQRCNFHGLRQNLRALKADTQDLSLRVVERCGTYDDSDDSDWPPEFSDDDSDDSDSGPPSPDRLQVARAKKLLIEEAQQRKDEQEEWKSKNPLIQAVVAKVGRAASQHLNELDPHGARSSLNLAGEGGMLLVKDQEQADLARRFCCLGYGSTSATKQKFTKQEIQSPDYNRHCQLGWNYRMSELQAAVALAQAAHHRGGPRRSFLSGVPFDVSSLLEGGVLKRDAWDI